jgi:NAD(P)-dependent dehydrogenase (short-subunit alcohol dehydrogenase family)
MAKTVLVTGGSRGIGRAIVRLAAEQGWSVAVNFAGNAAAANEAVHEAEATGARAVAIRGDVAVEADVVRMFDEAAAALGPLTALVNNAGIVAPERRLADMDADRIRRVMDVNVIGSYLCAREAARRMSRSRGGQGGAIVNVSSIAARLGSPGEYVDYAGSKGAINAMTIGLAKELGPEGIRVNAVSPGVIETEIHASGGRPDRAQTIGRNAPLGRAGTAVEVAEAVVWLLGDASAYVTGAVLEVSGGR